MIEINMIESEHLPKYVHIVKIDGIEVCVKDAWMRPDDYGIIFWHLTRISEKLNSIKQINFSGGIADGYQHYDDINDGHPVWSVEYDIVSTNNETIFILYLDRGTENGSGKL